MTQKAVEAGLDYIQISEVIRMARTALRLLVGLPRTVESKHDAMEKHCFNIAPYVSCASTMTHCAHLQLHLQLTVCITKPFSLIVVFHL